MKESNFKGGVTIAKLSEDIKKIIGEIHPAFVATASKEGKPNVSPKGSFRVLDDEHVIFAEIASPRTMANLKENPQVCAIVFDPATRRGCRVWGKVEEILSSGDLFESEKAERAKMKRGTNCVVKIAVEEATTL